jgi:hypothetical protein
MNNHYPTSLRERASDNNNSEQQLSAIPANCFDVCIKDNVFFIVFNFLS